MTATPHDQAPPGYALSLPLHLSLQSFARATQTHPDLIRRLVALGVLDAETDPAGQLWFSPAQVAAMARIKRLRANFSINYAAVGLVCDLLDRVAALEALVRATQPSGYQHSGYQRGGYQHSGGQSWTPTA